MYVDRPVRDAELAFLNAPFRESGWEEAIRRLAEVTGSAIAQFCGGGMGPALSFNVFSDDFHDPHGHLTNPALYGPENWRINCTAGGARSIQTERHYAAYRSANVTDFYDDAVSDLDLPFGCQTPLMLDSGGMIGMALLRSSRNGPCSPEVLATFAHLGRQAHRAVRVQLALGQERGEDMLASLARSDEMTLLLDRHCRLVAMTKTADTLFDCPIGLRLDGISVSLAEPGENRAFQAAVGRLLASDGISGPILHEAVAGRNPQRPEGYWRLYLTRLPTRDDLLGLEAQLALTLHPILPA